MSRATDGDIEAGEIPGPHSSSALSPAHSGDYLTLAPGTNFPLISDMTG